MMSEVVWVIFSLLVSFIINYVYTKINHTRYKISSHLILFAVLVIYGILAMQVGNHMARPVEFM